MPNIIEHHNPVAKTDYLSIQHLERYSFARSRLSAGMRVLDIATGSGYGAEMLLKFGCRVVGVDYDEVALATSRNEYAHKDLVRGDALTLPFKDGSFDAVVSFETIEHVVAGDKFLDEMSRVLRCGGLFISSTPNIKYTVHPE